MQSKTNHLVTASVPQDSFLTQEDKSSTESDEDPSTHTGCVGGSCCRFGVAMSSCGEQCG